MYDCCNMEGTNLVKFFHGAWSKTCLNMTWVGSKEFASEEIPFLPMTNGRWVANVRKTADNKHVNSCQLVGGCICVGTKVSSHLLVSGSKSVGGWSIGSTGSHDINSSIDCSATVEDVRVSGGGVFGSSAKFIVAVTNGMMVNRWAVVVLVTTAVVVLTRAVEASTAADWSA